MSESEAKIITSSFTFYIHCTPHYKKYAEMIINKRVRVIRVMQVYLDDEM